MKKITIWIKDNKEKILWSWDAFYKVKGYEKTKIKKEEEKKNK